MGKMGKKINKYLVNFLKTSLLVFSIFLFISPITLLKKNISSFMLIFSKNVVLSSIIGSLIGSISIGNPATAYIISAELLKISSNVALISAFIISWVTVGLAQIPLESKYFGLRFAVIRNVLGFIFSVIISLLIWLIY